MIAQLFTGCQFIAEEKILGGSYVDPMLMVGLEGMWGFLYYLILLPIFQAVPCDNENLCVPPYIEDSNKAFEDIGKYPFILGMVISTIISIACFNVLGVSITKYASAANRATVDSSRTLFIWCFQMGMGKETFKWLELVGFILLIGGTFVYNEIVILPCSLMKDYTKDEIKKREAQSQGLLDEDGGAPVTVGDNTNYMSSSPGALYDSNRNKRAIERNLNSRNELIKNH